MNWIEEKWQGLKNDVVPPDVSVGQVREMRRCFYAGAAALYNIMFDLGKKNASPDHGVAVLEEIVEELRAFQGLVEREED